MIFARVIELMVNQVSFLNDSQMLITQIQRKVLTYPRSKSKSDLGLRNSFHFSLPAGKVDRVQLGHPIKKQKLLVYVS